MDGENSDALAGTRARVRPILRLGIVTLLFGPGVSKFLTYDRSVQFFEALGLPAPTVLVLVVGVIELGVAVFLFLNRAPRLAALTAMPLMIVAAVTAGPTWQNLSVFVAAAILIWIDTKPERAFSTEPMT